MRLFNMFRQATTMDAQEELHAAAAKLSPRSSRPTCECCGKGKLELIDERPDPIFGVLGVIFAISGFIVIQVVRKLWK